MARGIGVDLAMKAPPPGELGGGYPEVEDEGKEAAVADMESFMGALGLEGDATAACEALDRYLVSAGFKKA